MIKFGVLKEETKDKGPFKIGMVLADGKPMEAEIVDMTGSEASPLKDSRCIIFTSDDDDGKAVALVFGPPVADRTDGQKPGEVTYKNHKRGQTIKLKDDGSVETKSPGNQNYESEKTVIIKSGEIVHINPT